MALDGSVNQRLDQLDKRETELLKKVDEQTELVKKLKDDRAYYRTKCDEKEWVVSHCLLLLKLSPVSTTRVDGPSWRVTGLLASGNRESVNTAQILTSHRQPWEVKVKVSRGKIEALRRS